MFARPRLTTTPPAICPATPLVIRGNGGPARSAGLQRSGANRTGYVERTVTTTDGVRLAVRDYGSATAAEHTVVLMHGLVLTQESWAAQVRQLQRRWGSSVRIVTYDHRGHGRSTGASMHTYRIERLAADLAEVLTALLVSGPLTLAGHSMGGMTALAYLGRPAAERPVEPHGLVLVATAGGRLTERGLGRLLGTPATNMLFDLVQRMPRRASDQVIKGLMRPVGEAVINHSTQGRADPNDVAAVTASAVRSISLATAVGFLPSLQRYDQYHTLASISAKTIVISGGTDMTTPAAHARDLAAAIPGATHLHSPDAGHMLLQEAPRLVSAAINSAMGMRRRSGCTANPRVFRRSSPTPQLAAVVS
jgi:pimeloyl-ACP methyl ester carboxylesterase